MSIDIPESYIDDDGRWVCQMRVMDAGVWSMMTGQPAEVPRDFPRWIVWRWPGLWLERRRCRRMAAQGPLSSASFMGTAKQTGQEITSCEINGATFFGPRSRLP